MMTDIETVRVLTGDNDISDAFVSFYLDSTEKFIKSYCNIETIPDELKPTLLEITALRVKANTSEGKSALGEGLKSVASVSDGNQSVSYGTGSSGSKSFVSEEDFVAAYGYMLDRYRRLVVNKRPCRTLGSRCMCSHKPKRW